MDLEWSEQEVAFRDEVRAFFKEQLTEELRQAGRLMTSVYADHQLAMQWQRRLLSKGWVAPAWPVAHGGCNWSVAQHYIFARERAAASAPPLSPMGIQMCAPALLAFGSEAQKRYYLPRMLTGEHLWCQGYSEPGAGSDLAALQLAAHVEGEQLVCTGSKIWVTHAQVANWIFCLVRTSREARPQLGITFLLIDMATPGISVKPIIAPSGEHVQNQVFFDQVRVPLANVVGQLGQGWTVAKYLLEFERGGVAYAPGVQGRLEEIRTFAASAAADHGGMLLDDPLFAAKLSAASIRAAALEIYELQALSVLMRGGSPGPAASVMKILGTELQQHVTELALEAAGRYGLAYQPQVGRAGGALPGQAAAGPPVGPLAAALAPLRYLNERAASIYAGSNEIQRNILAKAALGL